MAPSTHIIYDPETETEVDLEGIDVYTGGSVETSEDNSPVSSE